MDYSEKVLAFNKERGVNVRANRLFYQDQRGRVSGYESNDEFIDVG